MNNEGNNQVKQNYSSLQLQLIQFLLELFRGKAQRQYVTYNELRVKRPDLVLRQDELIKMFENNNKFHYDSARMKFTMKQKFNINNKAELYQLLLKTKEGIREDEDLFDCYRQAKVDLEALKAENKVRIIQTKNPLLQTILFGKDPNYENNTVVPDILKQMFLNKIQQIDTNYEKYKQFKNLNDNLHSRKKIKKLKKQRKRNNNYIFNEWMIGIIDFNSELNNN